MDNITAPTWPRHSTNTMKVTWARCVSVSFRVLLSQLQICGASSTTQMQEDSSILEKTSLLRPLYGHTPSRPATPTPANHEASLHL